MFLIKWDTTLSIYFVEGDGYTCGVDFKCCVFSLLVYPFLVLDNPFRVPARRLKECVASLESSKRLRNEEFLAVESLAKFIHTRCR